MSATATTGQLLAVGLATAAVGGGIAYAYQSGQVEKLKEALKAAAKPIASTGGGMPEEFLFALRNLGANAGGYVDPNKFLAGLQSAFQAGIDAGKNAVQTLVPTSVPQLPSVPDLGIGDAISQSTDNVTGAFSEIKDITRAQLKFEGNLTDLAKQLDASRFGTAAAQEVIDRFKASGASNAALVLPTIARYTTAPVVDFFSSKEYTVRAIEAVDASRRISLGKVADLTTFILRQPASGAVGEGKNILDKARNAATNIRTNIGNAFKNLRRGK